VVIVCFVFWLIFSILGVQLFSGKFYRCVYTDFTRLSAEEQVKSKIDCLEKGFTWQNSQLNFDTTLNGFLGKCV
jgi:hypothetical protein